MDKQERKRLIGEKRMKKNHSTIGGVKVNTLVIPLVIVLAILHIMIIIFIYEVNRSSSELAAMLEQSSTLQSDATNMHAANSILSETATTFTVVPTDKEGNLILGPLNAYAQELRRGRRNKVSAETFKKKGASRSIQAYISKATDYADQMAETQTHALSLMVSVYQLPPVPELEVIERVIVPLTAEEQAMPSQARVAKARSLILGQDYSQLKYKLNAAIENCHMKLQKDFDRQSRIVENHIRILRVALWGVVITIIIVLLGVFALFYAWVVIPMRRATEKIATDQKMDQSSQIYEVSILANAYNALLRRRNKLESILRSAAETDTLTGLPNRYSLEQNMIDFAEEGGSMAVLVFDVNFLKETNDSEGHAAGDRLLCATADCIRACFTGGENSCYRFGGDEFIAVMRGCDRGHVVSCIERFDEMQREKDISVSAGYAFDENVDDSSFKDLLSEADRLMYAQKKLIHSERETDHTNESDREA